MKPLLCSQCQKPVHIIGILGAKAVCVPCKKVFPGKVSTAGRAYFVLVALACAFLGGSLPSILPKAGMLGHLAIMLAVSSVLMLFTAFATRRWFRLFRF